MRYVLLIHLSRRTECYTSSFFAERAIFTMVSVIILKQNLFAKSCLADYFPFMNNDLTPAPSPKARGRGEVVFVSFLFGFEFNENLSV